LVLAIFASMGGNMVLGNRRIRGFVCSSGKK
jgi:hypothetical protein